MKFAEIKEKKKDDLEQLEGKLRGELAVLRIQGKAGQLTQTAKIGALKRDIARALTAMKQKEGHS